MKIRFNIDYHTYWGQKVMICGNLNTLGHWNENQALAMTPKTGGIWEAEIELRETVPLEYYYFIQDDNYGIRNKEWGEPRRLESLPSHFQEVEVHDFWRSTTNKENALFSSAFVHALLRPDTNRKFTQKSLRKLEADETLVRFQIPIPRIDKTHKVCVIGENQALGEWDEKRTIILDNQHHPLWTGEVIVKKTDFPIDYKYAIYDPETKKIDTWEEGANRTVWAKAEKNAQSMTICADEKFRYPNGNWKGAGVAIPVFSLRTQDSFGIGEYLDLKKLVDWSKKTGLKLIQILPINDTTAQIGWQDCYPYASISVFALHPIYLNLKAIGRLSDELIQKTTEEQGKFLNQKETLDYEGVIRLKFQYLRQIYEEQKRDFLRSQDFKEFYDQNQYWLAPYGAFCYLRDLHDTPDFSTWGRFSYLTPRELEDFVDTKNAHYEKIAFYYFLQYHADKQLKEATNYARENGIVLKGDIAIGIFRNSVDAWSMPQFFNMNGQAGAPPDDFSETGQNWKFPTYNWEAMEADGYTWWTKRLQKMADYFDAFRIDHILGFFRIWEIPYDYTAGLMGAFNKSLPTTAEELARWGIVFNEERFCKPYIHEDFLKEIFPKHADFVKINFLEEDSKGYYKFKNEVDTQRKVEELLTSPIETPPQQRTLTEKIKNGLLKLHGEVIFLKVEGLEDQFNPRNGMQDTYSFQELDQPTQIRLNEFYIHYFYQRHENFWRIEGLKKLPIVTKATEMLICGEDLGMVPDCVPDVMKELGILSLEVQRMPKNPRKKFGYPPEYPYLSVATPSSHDTSTVRGWWQEVPPETQEFYQDILRHEGGSPFFCEPWIVRNIIAQHLYSPSMWAIFPIQDLIGMDGNLRFENAEAERINEPSNPNHYWQYRFHIFMEDLLQEDKFNENLQKLISESGRNTMY